MGLVGLESSEMILGTLLTTWIVQKGSDPLVWLQDRLPHALRMGLQFLIQELKLISQHEAAFQVLGMAAPERLRAAMWKYNFA